MILPTLFSTLLLVVTAATLPATLSTLEPLAPRSDEPINYSRCLFAPHFRGYRSEAHASRPAKAEVTITDKSTKEKGDVGAGLHDNLLGECGHDKITQWQQPSVLSTSPWSNTVVAYNVWFTVGDVTDPACIQRAIQKAENQDVTCLPF